jgi:RNA polymerase sigma-70 factor (ECF subfamily)
MPIKYRMPLLLSKVEDLSLRENAQILNLRIPSLKTRLHRAFLMLKEEIDAYFNDRGTSSRLEPDGCCRKMTDFLYEYARQRIADKKKHPFDPHLKDCPACRLFFKRYLKAIQLTHSLQCRDMPEELKQRIVKFFKGKC